MTGRTHQIRVHAAEKGFPILGDTLYGGTPAARVCLHAAELTLRHPASGEEMTFRAPIERGRAGVSSAGPAEAGDGLRWLTGPLPCLALREAVIELDETNAYRVIHGASDGWPGWYVERLGDFLLSQSEQPLTPAQRAELAQLAKAFSARGTYHKVLTRQVGRAARAEASLQLALGEAAPERFTIRENGMQFEFSFSEGYSVGLFLDQRDNRRRLLTRHVGAGFPLDHSPPAAPHPSFEVLNTFAYTCGFSVCAAKAGARTTSLDLSKKWLDWGKRNFALNELDPAGHEFLYGDALDWLRRLAKKKRRFDVVLLDPPTFSQSKESGVFRAEKDYGRLVAAALPVLRSGGVLFASTNAADWPPEEFVASLDNGHPRRKPAGPPAPLRPAAAGFPHLKSRTGLSEDRVAASRVTATVHGFFSRSKNRVIRLACGPARDRRSSRKVKLATTPARTSPAIQMFLWRARVSAGTAVAAWPGGGGAGRGREASDEEGGIGAEAEASRTAGGAGAGALAGTGLGSGAGGFRRFDGHWLRRGRGRWERRSQRGCDWLCLGCLHDLRLGSRDRHGWRWRRWW